MKNSKEIEIEEKEEAYIISNRGRGKNNCQVKTKQFYKRYCNNIKEPISKKEFTDILSDINEAIIHEIIYDNYEFKLPCRIGYIRIQKKKTPYNKAKLKVDWKKTNKLWAEKPEAKEKKQFIYHLNENTDGYYYRFYFSKFTSNLKNKSAYSFVPTRSNQRLLSSYLKENSDVDYYE